DALAPFADVDASPKEIVKLHHPHSGFNGAHDHGVLGPFRVFGGKLFGNCLRGRMFALDDALARVVGAHRSRTVKDGFPQFSSSAGWISVEELFARFRERVDFRRMGVGVVSHRDVLLDLGTLPRDFRLDGGLEAKARTASRITSAREGRPSTSRR